MSPFEKVYQVVSKIPKGKVSTYKKVAEIAGVANARVVGFAMHANKDIINVPCHRVVGINGKLTGYARGGIAKKREMLEKEGIKFDSKDKINLKKYLVNP